MALRMRWHQNQLRSLAKLQVVWYQLHRLRFRGYRLELSYQHFKLIPGLPTQVPNMAFSARFQQTTEMPYGDNGGEMKDAEFLWGKKSLLKSQLPTRRGMIQVMSHGHRSLFRMAFAFRSCLVLISLWEQMRSEPECLWFQGH